MKKKEYKEPFIRVVEIKSCGILAGSGEGSYSETLPIRNFGSPEPGPEPGPEPDGDGYIWAD